MVDQGRIVEKGTHDELLAMRGIYAEYYAKQAAPVGEGSEPSPSVVTGNGGGRPELVDGRWSLSVKPEHLIHPARQ